MSVIIACISLLHKFLQLTDDVIVSTLKRGVVEYVQSRLCVSLSCLGSVF